MPVNDIICQGESMKKLFCLMFIIGLMGAMIFTGSGPATAASKIQQTGFPTPTPGPDGRILYTVQDGDTLWRIAAVAGISLDELRQLNNLSVDDVIRPGQVLLLGLAGPAAVTREPGATGINVLQLTPTPTQIMDASRICVLLYLDYNGDKIRQETEMGILGGEVSVTERTGVYSKKQGSKEGDPDDPDPLLNARTCFEDIPPGTYTVTMAIPEGWNETTVLNKTIELVPGDTSYLNFGAQLSSAASSQQSEKQATERSPLLGILGIGLLLLGVGLGVYYFFIGGRKDSSPGPGPSPGFD